MLFSLYHICIVFLQFLCTHIHFLHDIFSYTHDRISIFYHSFDCMKVLAPNSSLNFYSKSHIHFSFDINTFHYPLSYMDTLHTILHDIAFHNDDFYTPKFIHIFANKLMALHKRNPLQFFHNCIFNPCKLCCSYHSFLNDTPSCKNASNNQEFYCTYYDMICQLCLALCILLRSFLCHNNSLY